LIEARQVSAANMANGVRQIVFLRWVDPIRALVDKARGGEAVVAECDSDDDIGYQAARDSFTDDFTDPPQHIGPILCGPLGIIPIHEGNIPSRLFNFWVGHTNFDVRDCTAQIAAVPGVEDLNVWTRYRFRVCIGKMFDEGEVLSDIEKTAQCGEITQDGRMSAITNTVRRMYKHWAVYQMPNGKFEIVSGETRKEVDEKGGQYAAFAKRAVFSWQ
jgi:hypothetical protein